MNVCEARKALLLDGMESLHLAYLLANAYRRRAVLLHGFCSRSRVILSDGVLPDCTLD